MTTVQAFADLRRAVTRTEWWPAARATLSVVALFALAVWLTQRHAAVVEAAIRALPEDLRVAITLREFEGLSYEDIASVMGCPVGTVRSRIFRAREAIDQRIGALMAEGR